MLDVNHATTRAYRRGFDLKKKLHTGSGASNQVAVAATTNQLAG